MAPELGVEEAGRIAISIRDEVSSNRTQRTHDQTTRRRGTYATDVEPWWRQAQADLETARVTASAGRHYAASWFAQQAVEKGLKALYIEQRGALAPRA